MIQLMLVIQVVVSLLNQYGSSINVVIYNISSYKSHTDGRYVAM